MSCVDDWNFRLQHILEAIARIQEYTAGLPRREFDANQMLIDAVVRNFEILGEAARHVPKHIQDSHPEVPWKEMQKMRHVLVHDYYMVNLDIVWSAIQNDLPPLIAPLEHLLELYQQDNAGDSPGVVAES